jgi:nicotinate-nucleotide--dimethylbenzimidazole phosphoribosyltransferase
MAAAVGASGHSPRVAEAVAAVRPLDADAVGQARERQDRLTKPRGALGVLEDVAVRLAGLAGSCPAPVPEPAAVAVFAADHGVHAQGVTPWPQEVTAQMVANFVAGGAAVNAFAAQVGATVVVVDVGVAGPLERSSMLLDRKVRAGTRDFTRGAALTRAETVRAVEVGMDVAAGPMSPVTAACSPATWGSRTRPPRRRSSRPSPVRRPPTSPAAARASTT